MADADYRKAFLKDRELSSTISKEYSNVYYTMKVEYGILHISQNLDKTQK